MFIRFVQTACLTLMLTGCAASSAVGVLTSLASTASQGFSADLQVGDKATQVTTTGKTEASSAVSSVEKVEAKSASVDQSNKKTDRKTEIGEVKGDVKVTQGPSIGILLFLGAGWPLFLGFLIYLIRRRMN